MDRTVTVRDVMTREFVGVSESDSLFDTAALLLEESADAAVVVRGDEPVGMVTPREVLRHVVDGKDPTAATVADAMAETVATVGPRESLAAAADVLSTADVRGLPVTEGGQPVGLLTEHDLVTAITPAPVDAEADLDEEEAALTNGGVVDDEYTTQSVCEVCGGLARELVNVNGQVVCTDCRGV